MDENKGGESICDSTITRYKIMINDIYYGKIKRNETKEFEVDDGHYTIYAKLDYDKSNPIRVEVTNSKENLNTIINLEVGCRQLVLRRGFDLWMQRSDHAE